MIKNRIDFKLINVVLFVLAVYLVYQARDFWVGIISLIFNILLPFLIAFAIAYAFYPIVKKLTDRNVPKALAMLLVVGGAIGVICLILALITPTIMSQLTSLFNGIISFLKELSTDYNVNFKDIQNTLSAGFNDTLEKLGTYISNGALSFIGVSIDYISKIFIILASFVYFLADMDKIRKFIKEYLSHKSKKIYNYVATIDDEMRKYIVGFMKIVVISFFEYTITYTLIGHPNALMLGTLAALGNLIPYFGGIITNIVAAITAFVISPALFIKTCIVFIVFSAVDGYIINPFVYGNSNQVHPLVVIISVFAGGALLGVLGIVISLPVAIIAIATFKYFKNDIINMNKKRKRYKIIR